MAGAVCFLAASVSWGQTTDPINSSLQFNFSNPGARSLGLAGAFTARADDATAVYANPAGLIQLSQPEVSSDLRSWELSRRFLEGGEQRAPASLDGLTFDETDDSVEGLSFLAALLPTGNGRWIFGVFRHESANYRTEVRSQGSRLIKESPGDADKVRPVDGVYALGIESFGFSVARRLGDSWSVGATLTFSRFDLASRVERWNHLKNEPRPDDRLPDVIGDPEDCCTFAPREDIAVYFTQVDDEDDDEDVTLTLGVMWQSPREVAGAHLVTVGAVYRPGPEFGFIGDVYRNSSLFDRQTGLLVGTFEPQVVGAATPEGCNLPDRPGCPGRFRVPDVLGLGVSLRPSLRWVIALDVNRISYSDLVARILDIDNADSNLVQGELGAPSDFAIDDGTEYRLGVEYGLYRERTLPDIFLRAGAWIDPDHQMRYTGGVSGSQAVWTGGDDELHWAAGLGVRYRRFQVDLAVDLSERVNTASLSAVYYFGR